MAFKPAVELSKLQQENRFVTLIDGKKILLIWHKDQVHAINSQCPHLKLPLARGKITENNTIICPFHRSEFNLSNGESICWSTWPPALGSLLGKISKEKNLTIYPTQIKNGHVYVNVN